MDLSSLLERVSDRTSFIVFVRALASDARIGDDWQNSSIGDYLEAAAAWGEDSARLPGALPEAASWKALALFLYSGKIYE